MLYLGTENSLDMLLFYEKNGCFFVLHCKLSRRTLW